MDSLEYEVSDDDYDGAKKKPKKEAETDKKAVQLVARPLRKRNLSQGGQFAEEKWKRRKEELQHDFSIGSCLSKEKLALLSPQAEALAKSPAITATDKGLLCIPCQAANVKSAWGRGTAADSQQGLKHHFVKRHIDSNVHKQTVDKMLGTIASMGPAKEEFTETWPIWFILSRFIFIQLHVRYHGFILVVRFFRRLLLVIVILSCSFHMRQSCNQCAKGTL